MHLNESAVSLRVYIKNVKPEHLKLDFKDHV